jgi:hypothetical protein
MTPSVSRRRLVVKISLSLLIPCLLFVSCSYYEKPEIIQHTADNNSIAVQPQVPANIAASGTVLDIKSFQAQPKHVTPGENTTLSWDVAGATAISIEPSVGNVSGNTGNIVVSPTETTLYSLQVTDGHIETVAKFLVIVKTSEGSIIWPNSGTRSQVPIYEGWSYYPNNYVNWTITDNYRDPYTDTDTCWHIGYITNNHPEWMMTEIMVNNKLVLGTLLPGIKQGYTVTIDCKELPELKWKWKK